MVRFIQLRAANFQHSDANVKEYYGVEISVFQFIPLCLLLRGFALTWNARAGGAMFVSPALQRGVSSD
jgi:hypothetical protein